MYSGMWWWIFSGNSGNDEEDFANDDGDWSTEDEDECCDGNLVYIDKDLNHSKDL